MKVSTIIDWLIGTVPLSAAAVIWNLRIAWLTVSNHRLLIRKKNRLFTAPEQHNKSFFLRYRKNRKSLRDYLLAKVLAWKRQNQLTATIPSWLQACFLILYLHDKSVNQTIKPLNQRKRKLKSELLKHLRHTPLEWQKLRAFNNWYAIHFFSNNVRKGLVLNRS